jgi:ribosomal protein L29
MSSNLFPYKYSKEEWYKADFFNESDVAVIVDTSREIIWLYTGKSSTARKRINARELLNDLMKNYSSYALKDVSEETPDDILAQLEDLREEYFRRRMSTLTYDIRKVSNTFFYISCLACLLLILAFTFSILGMLGSGTSLLNGYNHVIINVSNFSFQVIFIASLILASFLSFIITFLIALFLRKKSLIFYIIITLIFSFLGFFLITNWDSLIFSEIIGQVIFFRVDVFTLYIVNLNIILIIPLGFGITLIIIGSKKILEYP